VVGVLSAVACDSTGEIEPFCGQVLRGARRRARREAVFGTTAPPVVLLGVAVVIVVVAYIIIIIILLLAVIIVVLGLVTRAVGQPSYGNIVMGEIDARRRWVSRRRVERGGLHAVVDGRLERCVGHGGRRGNIVQPLAEAGVLANAGDEARHGASEKAGAQGKVRACVRVCVRERERVEKKCEKREKKGDRNGKQERGMGGCDQTVWEPRAR
jgi:hypothetical protein